MRTLIVDDSRAMRRIISDIMLRLGYEVHQATNGIDALQKLEELGVPDVLLVDWNMPEMNGIELIKAIRAHPDYCLVPIMMVTTETHVGCMEQAILAGANEYVMKPFDQATISEKLQLLGVGV